MLCAKCKRYIYQYVAITCNVHVNNNAIYFGRGGYFEILYTALTLKHNLHKGHRANKTLNRNCAFFRTDWQNAWFWMTFEWANFVLTFKFCEPYNIARAFIYKKIKIKFSLNEYDINVVNILNEYMRQA